MTSKHAILVAGTQSGCGKTTLTLALIAALRARNLSVQPFKVGPDFIDPGLHTQLAGAESRNLDGWMLSREVNRLLFTRLLDRADVALVEGVMGLYDGYDGVSESGSSAEMAKWLGLPVLLIVDARSMARSAAALVHGFKDFDRDLNLLGVLFNRIGGEGHLHYLKEAMAASLPDVPVLGGIPADAAIELPERHLGLVTADEIQMDSHWRERLIGLMERHVNLDLLLEKTRVQKQAASGGTAEVSGSNAPRVTIAVARDAAFCFYYPDNFDLLRRAGARLHFFSPLAGETFPEDTAGLYLGGGYPELFAVNLAAQEGFLTALRRAAGQGMPIYAECGGLMTLSRFIETLDGRRHAMAGLLPFGTRMLNRRKALGYTEVVLRRSCLLGEEGLVLRGHEFHYSEIVEADMEQESPAGVACAYRLRMRKHRAERCEGYMVRGALLASYIHLHWGSAPDAAGNFVRRCADYACRVARAGSTLG